MHILTARRAAGLLGVLLALSLAACGSSSHSSQAGAAASSARAAASSELANPTVSADMAQLESRLLAAYQKNFSPIHPITSMETAIHVVFPSGDSKAIATYAVSKLTPAMAHHTNAGKAARLLWAQQVVTEALGSNPGATASPGSANIPGAPAPSSSVSGT
jgi:hypothetical protein